MSDIVIVSGSPSSSSRSDRVLHYSGSLVEKEGFSVRHFSVKSMDAEDLLFGNFHSPEIKEIISKLQEAKGVIVGTPVYKTSYYSILKALYEILTQDILNDTNVLKMKTC